MILYVSIQWCFHRNYLERPSDVERVSSKDRSESLKHGMTLFAHRAEIATDPAKGGDARFTAKGASDLLLNAGPCEGPARPDCS
jgi:hypothetical protein